MSFNNCTNILKDITSKVNENGQITIGSMEQGKMLSPSTSNQLYHNLSSESDSDDDDYCISDEEELDNINSNPNYSENHKNYSTGMTDHIAYLSNSLSYALDSLHLDKSLVLQAQLSGQLNNEKQKIIDKRKELVDKIENVKNLYAYNFGSTNEGLKSSVSRVETLRQDITQTECRIDRLKSGTPKENGTTFQTIFKSKNQNIGIANKYPIEYNQAKDKVLERQIEE